MHYDDQGAGIPLLFIHGYPLNRRMWEPQIASLADIARVVAPDLRGHGDSETAPSPDGDPQTYSMDLHARDCAALLDAMDIQQPVVIAGLSMGGYIALSFYRQYPERIAGLVLAATRAGSDSADSVLNRMEAVELARHSGIEAIAETMLPKLFSPHSYDTLPDLIPNVRNIMQTISLEGVAGDQLGMIDRPDSTPLLAEIEIPTLLIHGADDQIINIEDMDSMQAAIPSSQLQVIPGAGHLVNLEQPDIFNKAVREFILNLE